MFYLKKVSNRKVKNHATYHRGLSENEFIPAGTPYLQVLNGTIGHGARYINISIKDIQELFGLEKPAELEVKTEHVKEQEDNFNYEDDIPF